ncbi:MAG TPA: glutathione S-transferase N-terminal domain-containing protein [Rhizomicrobium sp.]|nr:glutathione S-transferase N-terminal domain-containing protein [Rhizomicrobium sp.]
MKLFMSATSPFARKVRIVIREKGLTDKVEEIPFVPIEAKPELLAINPLSQIPALIDDDGVSWTDSSLIAAWLDQQGSGPAFLPPAGTDEYWRVRRVETAAMGLFEMIAKLVYEYRRPENERSPFWLQRWRENLKRGFERAEAIGPQSDTLDMGSLTLAIAGTSCDFRLPDIDWRTIAPRISRLNETLEKRQSFIDTAPK